MTRSLTKRFEILSELKYNHQYTEMCDDFIELFGKLLINYSRNIFQSTSSWNKIRPTLITIKKEIDKEKQNIIYQNGAKVLEIQQNLIRFMNFTKMYKKILKTIPDTFIQEYIDYIKSTLPIICNDLFDMFPYAKQNLKHIITKYRTGFHVDY